MGSPRPYEAKGDPQIPFGTTRGISSLCAGDYSSPPRNASTPSARVTRLVRRENHIFDAVMILPFLMPRPPSPALPRSAVRPGQIWRSLAWADQPYDWDRYHARQDACLEADRIAQECTGGVEHCDELALRQARRACSAFGPLGERSR